MMSLRPSAWKTLTKTFPNIIYGTSTPRSPLIAKKAMTSTMNTLAIYSGRNSPAPTKDFERKSRTSVANGLPENPERSTLTRTSWHQHLPFTTTKSARITGIIVK